MIWDILRSYLGVITDIPDDEWDRLRPGLREAFFEKGSFFIEYGEHPKDACFVVQGLLESFYSDDDGRENIKRFCPERTFAAPYADLIQNQLSSCYIRAIEDTKVILINYAHWRSLMDTHMCWQKIGRIIAEAEFIEREQREKSFMTEDARSRYEMFKKRYPTLIDRVPKNRIAAYLNMNPVTLSRLMNP